MCDTLQNANAQIEKIDNLQKGLQFIGLDSSDKRGSEIADLSGLLGKLKQTISSTNIQPRIFDLDQLIKQQLRSTVPPNVLQYLDQEF